MVDHRAIMSLLFKHRSYAEITVSTKCSRRDVSMVKKAIESGGITAEQCGTMSAADIAALFPDGRSNVSSEYVQPDFGRVVAAMKSNRHFTIQQAWTRYMDAAPGAGKKYRYSQFAELFGRFAEANDVVATLRHEPGKSMFVDWVGDTLDVQDAVTGQLHKAYLFVASLPFSGLVFCEAFANMKQDAWNQAHVDALAFINGVTQIIVPDNASTAVHRRQRGDTERVVTARYRELAEHYGTAIVPAAPYRPRHKAHVESMVNTVEKRVIGYLAEETWTTFAELNEAIAERLVDINERIHRPDGTTRQERFDAEESPFLLPLPELRFESVEWKELKVGRNYHVGADYQQYSVPYQLAGRTLRVRLTGTTVTIFDGQQIVCEHARKLGRKGQYSTVPEHAPEQHRNIDGLWSRQWFLDLARGFGPATVQVITQVLDRFPIEAQGYLPCQNILGGLGKKNKARLEAACQQALNLGGYPTYSTLKRIMAAIAGDAQAGGPPVPAASNEKNTTSDPGQPGVMVRGADHYKIGGQRNV
ncbi:IS21 family transposase [Paeniglutamicibacter sulfureus]|uniref:IS21 family transposase n=1 Tax=Paeniglutamicibacter sulfureus TaxID=43666 RepID=UPI0026654131|nr:IS21 family transposase [Paeniglutamicibacter sulfureus]MDO2932969.1 IS21 family transposase [Paeniglutamicibacter sulfureus]MDO2935987.1 IS21 family transposase [Paeniglutamicibacter sulfureus]